MVCDCEFSFQVVSSNYRIMKVDLRCDYVLALRRKRISNDINNITSLLTNHLTNLWYRLPFLLNDVTLIPHSKIRLWTNSGYAISGNSKNNSGYVNQNWIFEVNIQFLGNLPKADFTRRLMYKRHNLCQNFVKAR